MAKIRQTKFATLSRRLVAPMLLLFILFRRPVFQWLALAAAALWLFAEIYQAFWRKRMRRKTQRSLRLSEPRDRDSENKDHEELDEHDLFLIRQINYRITEQLKETYPMVSWIWQVMPNAAQLCKGGIWRICLSNTEPFNYGEVEITRLGKISITLLQAVSLKDSAGIKVEQSEDIAEEDLLERVDVKAWYLDHGEQLLSQIIDDLNTQGHRQLLIKEDGSVCVKSSGTEMVVDSVLNFPPRKTWDEFITLLSEDEIIASVKPEGLLMAWN